MFLASNLEYFETETFPGLQMNDPKRVSKLHLLTSSSSRKPRGSLLLAEGRVALYRTTSFYPSDS